MAIRWQIVFGAFIQNSLTKANLCGVSGVTNNIRSFSRESSNPIVSKLNVLKLILTAFVGPFCQRENLPTTKTLCRFGARRPLPFFELPRRGFNGMAGHATTRVDLERWITKFRLGKKDAAACCCWKTVGVDSKERRKLYSSRAFNKRRILSKITRVFMKGCCAWFFLEIEKGLHTWNSMNWW